jgi:hypothetical protein
LAPGLEDWRALLWRIGNLDGRRRRTCASGERLKEEFEEMRASKKLAESLVTIDGRFEAQSGREVLVVQRPASLLTGERCPG